MQPKRQKYRKSFRGQLGRLARSGSHLIFGEYGLKSLSRGWLTSAQIEAGRKVIAHATKREGKILIRVFPDRPRTAKGQGVGMGAGKGEIVGYLAAVAPGRILFELAGVNREIAREAFRKAADKLPFETKLVSKEEK